MPAAAMPPPVQQAAPQASAGSLTCREFQQSIVVDGQPQDAYGTTCQQPDGTWKVMAAPAPAAQAAPPQPQPQVAAAAVPVYPSYPAPAYYSYPAYAYGYPYYYPSYVYGPTFYGGLAFRGRFR
jgi:hypothetical protein